MRPQTQTTNPLMRAPRQRRSGQVLVVTAVCIIGLLAIVGLIADGGMLAVNRRHAQRAADAAALAGAWELRAGSGATQEANARAAAINLALLNGAPSTNCVLVEIPPAASSGSRYAGTNRCIRVEVTRPMDTTFMRLLLQLSVVNVRASATAGPRSIPYQGKILVLSPNASNALDIRGNASIDVGGGDIYVNSTSGQAINMVGGSSITAGTVKVVGGISQAGGSTINATVVPGAPAEIDPLATLPAPVLSSYSVSPDSAGTANNPQTKQVSGPATLRPGIYYGGVKISGGTVTMQPGTYIMAGGGFNMSDGTLNGTDVFIYNTQNPTKPTKEGAYGNVTLNGTLNIQAPDAAHDSTYKGVLVFNDRASTTSFSISNTASPGVTPFAGYVYNPGGSLELTGGDTIDSIGAIVKTIRLVGNSRWRINAARSPGTFTVALIE
ncbi:MAG: pilus assembly protein TadG-related protein [Verrucomicrobiae bacterium]|nr:pilus assembly protein TadG-related protein [Verrucomicrobiae bacterium]